jgi:hypothetical protein
MYSAFLTRVLNSCGMGTHPGYFSGRGVNGSDLDDKILERIYQAIVENKGQEAGNAFVDMVEGIPVLSATDFMLTLQSLEAHDYVWNAVEHSARKKGVYPDSLGSAFATVVQAMGGAGAFSRNEDKAGRDARTTLCIRGEFLMRHGKVVDGYHDRYRYDYPRLHIRGHRAAGR